MIEKFKKYADIQILKKFVYDFVLFAVFTILCCSLATKGLSLRRDAGYIISFSVLYAALMCLWNGDFRHKLLCFAFIGIYLFSALLEKFDGMILQECEIIHTIGLAIILYSIPSYIFYTALLFKNTFLRRFFKVLSLVLLGTFMLPALVFLGYRAVNQGIFSADIMLTLFQTNFNEMTDYLAEQNLLNWTIGTVCMTAFILMYIYCAVVLKKQKFASICYVFVLVWIIYGVFTFLPKLDCCNLVSITETTKAALDGFDDLEVSLRAKQKDLQSLTVEKESRGVYVLVIGESETKDHMQLYGYDRATTPWLMRLASNKNTFVFQNAYANHTHTVPALTYSLSNKNQYNNVDWSSMYSLLKVAKAAGYKTYWISNQAKYSLIDTPITIMASDADVQHWLNTNGGERIFTSYYDEETAAKIPNSEENQKMLIIVHLMGCHSAYQERYPMNFSYFQGENTKVDTYDNSVRYNDYVLHKIYDKVKKYPNFKAFVYFSDHGEDPDNALGHESSRFTYKMARIPLIINLSESFVKERKQQADNLKANINAFWTNDLIYDLMVSFMEIDGLPNLPEKFDLLSQEYNLPPEKVKLLHGQKNLQNEIINKK